MNTSRRRLLLLVLVTVAVCGVSILSYVVLSRQATLRYIRSAGGDYRLSLPNNCRLSRTSSDNVLLVGPDGSIVTERSVALYSVVGHLVVGKWYAPEEAPAYFIFDTTTAGLQQGLNAAQWAAALKSRGVSTVPTLVRPTHP